MVEPAIRLSVQPNVRRVWHGDADDTASCVQRTVLLLLELYKPSSLMVRSCTWDEWGVGTPGAWEPTESVELAWSTICEVQSCAGASVRLAVPEGSVRPDTLMFEDNDQRLRQGRVRAAPALFGLGTAWLEPLVPTGRGFALSIGELGHGELTVGAGLFEHDDRRAASLPAPGLEAWRRANGDLRSFLYSHLQSLGWRE